MIRITVKSAPHVKEPCDLLAVPIFSGDDKLGTAARAVDRAAGGVITRLRDTGEFSGKRDELVVQAVSGGKLGADRIALLGCGDRDEFTPEVLRRAASVLASHARDKAATCVLVFDDLPLGARSAEALGQAATEGARLALYDFAEFKKSEKARLKHLRILVGKDRWLSAVRAGAKWGEITAGGAATARDLGNLPGNHGRPKILASKARAMGRKVGLKVSVMGRAAMEKAKMGSLLSVALGSPHEPQLIIMEHRPAKAKKDMPTICLVGKGLTFDSGGISIKPSSDMDKMRYDKCGGCVVIGTMQAVAEAGLQAHVIGIVPSSENMPGGDANKPGDVVTASNGKTIEILNTDAEGRLILADALVHATKFKPDVVIDLATLTGACMVALGTHCCGLMTPDDELAAELSRAGEAAHERAWRLPLWEEYSEEMKGSTTDLKNLGGRYGGAITAGAFLENFTGDHRWAHLDIAGVSWDDAKRPYNRSKGATGFGVRLLMQYLRDLTGR